MERKSFVEGGATCDRQDGEHRRHLLVVSDACTETGVTGSQPRETAEQIAAGLTRKMVGTLGTGHASSHSATVIGPKPTLDALRRRGLIGDDNRWTTLGFEVAALVLTGRVMTIDDLHDEALAEDRRILPAHVCPCARNPLGHTRAEHEQMWPGDNARETEAVERAVCRHDRRPIARRTDRGPRAKWHHDDERGGLGCTNGVDVAEPNILDDDHIRFPRAVCIDDKPHGPHRIIGTWRDRCPGRTTPEAQRAAAEAPAHVRKDCPALPVGCEHCTAPATVRAAVAVSEGLPASEGPAHLDGCVTEGGITTCADGCPRFVAVAATRRPSPAETEQWIVDQVKQLSENELLLIKAVLDEIAAGRPVEHFAPGTKVYVGSWGTTEFVVQGTGPWYDRHGIPHRKVEIKSKTGGLSGHVDPRELRRVP